METIESSQELTDEKKAQQESFKLLFEVYKHITTLSSGTIVILTTFLDKIFKYPKLTHLIAISIACFLLSLITSLPVMVDLAEEQQISRKSKRFNSNYRRFIYSLSPTTFVFGTLCLTMFAIINLYK